VSRSLRPGTCAIFTLHYITLPYKCECNEADQTPEHILQNCPQWRTHVAEVFIKERKLHLGAELYFLSQVGILLLVILLETCRNFSTYMRCSSLGMALVHFCLLCVQWEHCLNGAVGSSKMWRTQNAYPFNLRCLHIYTRNIIRIRIKHRKQRGCSTSTNPVFVVKVLRISYHLYCRHCFGDPEKLLYDKYVTDLGQRGIRSPNPNADNTLLDRAKGNFPKCANTTDQTP
jgi:hypothetical protein